MIFKRCCIVLTKTSFLLRIISSPCSLHLLQCSPALSNVNENIVGFIQKIHRVPDIMQLNVDVDREKGEGIGNKERK